MIDPFKITNFKRSEEELEEFWLFCICVAGKTASIVAKLYDEFLTGTRYQGSPFTKVEKMIKNGVLVDHLKRARLGQYSRLEKSFKDTVNAKLDLRKCTVSDLEEIHGVGPKTSRFFLLHSRRNQKIAVLDVHVLKYLKNKGYDVPKITPDKKRYADVEQMFLTEAKKQKLSIADFDLKIWSEYATK